jgi:hypothetical protein
MDFLYFFQTSMQKLKPQFEKRRGSFFSFNCQHAEIVTSIKVSFFFSFSQRRNVHAKESALHCLRTEMLRQQSVANNKATIRCEQQSSKTL